MSAGFIRMLAPQVGRACEAWLLQHDRRIMEQTERRVRELMDSPAPKAWNWRLLRFVEQPPVSRARALQMLARREFRYGRNELSGLLDVDREKERAVRHLLGACRLAERSRDRSQVEMLVDVRYISLLFDMPEAKIPDRLERLLA